MSRGDIRHSYNLPYNPLTYKCYYKKKSEKNTSEKPEAISILNEAELVKTAFENETFNIPSANNKEAVEASFVSDDEQKNNEAKECKIPNEPATTLDNEQKNYKAKECEIPIEPTTTLDNSTVMQETAYTDDTKAHPEGDAVEMLKYLNSISRKSKKNSKRKYGLSSYKDKALPEGKLSACLRIIRKG